MKHLCIFCLLVAVFSLLLTLSTVHAQDTSGWPSDSTTNVPICIAEGGQRDLQMFSDGAGGAIIFWRDWRDGSDDPMEVYAQHVDASGNTLWMANGIHICTAGIFGVVSDGQGGTIIVWLSGEDGCMHAQRVDVNGNVLWETVCGGAFQGPAISDGEGGAIMVWLPVIGTRDEIYAQRVDSKGRLLWSENGDPICIATLERSLQGGPSVVSDGEGGVIVLWVTHAERSLREEIYVQRIGASGNLLWQDGVPVYTGDSQFLYAEMASDGSGGAIIAWNEHSDEPRGIYAQRVDPDGSLLWGNGVHVLHSSGPLVLVTNGSGDTIIIVYHGKEIHAQRVDAAGELPWGRRGTLVCTVPFLTFPYILSGVSSASDKFGGVVIAWEHRHSDDRLSDLWDIYAQRLDASGRLLWGDAAYVCTAPGRQFTPRLVSDGDGGAIIAWNDARGDSYDIYAQNVQEDGSLGGISGIHGVSEDSGEVIFPDPNLEAAIRKELHKPEGTMTKEELAQLVSLNASGLGIADLTGIEHCTNMQYLYLSGSKIVSIEPLKNLSKLDWLDLEYNEIGDISPLAGLANLQYLWLSSNEVKDIDPLRALINLKQLLLDRNPLEDINPLRELANLEVLSLSLSLRDNQIKDISPLSGLTSLVGLDLQYNQIEDISPLRGLTNLEELDLGDNQIEDISPLSNLTKLQAWLNLSYNQVEDIGPLSRLTSLEVLRLGSNRVSDIVPLKALNKLRELDLHGNKISDIYPLVGNAGLGEGDKVNLRGNPLSAEAYDNHIPALQERGVELLFYPRSVPASLRPIGDGQSGVVGDTLTIGAQVLDQNSDPMEGVVVYFDVIDGNGGLSKPQALTEADGRALVQLTLNDRGKISVKANASGEEATINVISEGPLDQPPTVDLIAPLNNTYVISQYSSGITFRWQGHDPEDDELRYRLIIDDDGDPFVEPLIQCDVGVKTIYVLPETLDSGVYYWAIEVSDGEHIVYSQEIRSLSVSADPPLNIEILSPESDFVVALGGEDALLSEYHIIANVTDAQGIPVFTFPSFTGFELKASFSNGDPDVVLSVVPKSVETYVGTYRGSWSPVHEGDCIITISVIQNGTQVIAMVGGSVRMPQESSITGTVADMNGVPIPGAAIDVDNSTSVAVTGSDGSYSISGISIVKEEIFALTVRADGYSIVSRCVEILPGHDKLEDFKLLNTSLCAGHIDVYLCNEKGEAIRNTVEFDGEYSSVPVDIAVRYVLLDEEGKPRLPQFGESSFTPWEHIVYRGEIAPGEERVSLTAPRNGLYMVEAATKVQWSREAILDIPECFSYPTSPGAIGIDKYGPYEVVSANHAHGGFPIILKLAYTYIPSTCILTYVAEGEYGDKAKLVLNTDPEELHALLGSESTNAELRELIAKQSAKFVIAKSVSKTLGKYLEGPVKSAALRTTASKVSGVVFANVVVNLPELVKMYKKEGLSETLAEAFRLFTMGMITHKIAALAASAFGVPVILIYVPLGIVVSQSYEAYKEHQILQEIAAKGESDDLEILRAVINDEPGPHDRVEVEIQNRGQAIYDLYIVDSHNYVLLKSAPYVHHVEQLDYNDVTELKAWIIQDKPTISPGGIKIHYSMLPLDNRKCEYFATLYQLGYEGDNTIRIVARSPVHLAVTDPNGRTITKDKNDIPNAEYAEFDLDGDIDTETVVSIPEPLDGNYVIQAIPKSDAKADDTYTLEVLLRGQKVMAAEDVSVKDIPEYGYKFNTVTGKAVVLLSARILHITGTVYENDGLALAPAGLIVKVQNTTKGASQTDQTGKIAGEGKYSVTFVDFMNDGIAATGDEIHVTVAEPEGGLLGEVTHSLTNEEIGAGKAIINITLNPTSPHWDVNQDGKTDILDLIMVGRHFGKTPPAKLKADINADGKVDISDLILVGQHFGE